MSNEFEERRRQSLDEALAQAAANMKPGSESDDLNDDESSAAEYERLRVDLAEAKDRTLRAQAELENYRKRARREMDDERRYASLPLLADLLPVLDNLQRAILSAEKNPEGSTLLEGVKLVKQQFDSVLARYNCVKIDALGKPFDPAFHEAIGQQPSPSHPAQTVLIVAQDGYTLNERVVRPAQVIVSTDPSAS